MKRVFDILLAGIGLLILSPILIILMLFIFLQDGHSPLYVSSRVGKNGKLFKMVKLRTMIMGADSTGVNSTSADDNRITAIGHFTRKFKLDELPQLWNVFIGDMSIIGPRPNVKAGTDLYADWELKLLTVKPGISDFSSIIFSDEGDILKGKKDPDKSYNELIRPWKSKLGIIYIDNQSFSTDVKIIFWTIMAIIDKRKV